MYRKNWRFLLSVALFWFAQYVFIPFFPPYLTAMGISATVAGSIVGAYGFSQMLLRIPFGVGADKLRSHKLFMMLGFICVIVASLILCRAGSPVIFLFARLLSGVASSTWVSFTVFFSGKYPESSGKAIGAIMTVNNAGQFLGFVCGMLLFDFVGIQNLFIISALASLAGLILVITIRETRAQSGKPMRLGDIAGVLKNRNLLLQSALAASAQLIIFATTQSFTANYAKQIHATGRQLAMLSIVFGAVGIVGSYWMSTEQSEKISDRTKLTGAFLLMAIYCVMVPHCGNMAVLYAAQVIAGVGRAVSLSLTMTLALREISGELRSTAMGVYQSVYGVGMTLGPILMGAALDVTQGSFFAAYNLIGAISLLSAVWILIVRFPRKNM